MEFIRGLPTTVTFTTPDPVLLPLPDPKYLALHAVCARVAHLSGAGEHFEELDRDTEEIAVLANDRRSYPPQHSLAPSSSQEILAY